jgi:hypothetical protein
VPETTATKNKVENSPLRKKIARSKKQIQINLLLLHL